MINNRKILIISGADSESFLQQLVTNNVKKIGNDLQYNLLLSPQGKLLHDFFILKITDNDYWLDCYEEAVDDIIAILIKYRLGSKVEFSINDSIFVNSASNGYRDPRHEKLPFRAYSATEISEEDNYDIYYQLSLPRLYNDFESGRYFPFEVGFDKFNAISYTKGCYIGQEVITRTHHRGSVRKKVYRITSDMKLTANSDLFIDDKKIGVILGIYWQGNALALLNSEMVSDNLKSNDGFKVSIVA